MAFPRIPRWLPSLRGPHLEARIFFPHVPKCAGVSVAKAIRDRYRLDHHLRGHFASIKAEPTVAAASLERLELGDLRRGLLSYHLAREDLVFVTGHVGCGAAQLDAFADRWHFVTVLRDPVERYLSEYFYNRHKASEHVTTRLPLEDFVRSDHGRYIGQTYVGYFSGLPPAAPVQERTDQAFENLGRFGLVGFVDDMESFRRAFTARFGAPLALKRSNANPAPDYEPGRVPDDLRAEIEDVCAPDIALYRRLRSA